MSFHNSSSKTGTPINIIKGDNKTTKIIVNKKVKMGTDLLNSLENDPNIEISDRVRGFLDSYKKDLDDGTISEADFYEEVMAVTSDGLTDGGVNIKDIGLFKSIGDKILQTIGWKQN